jgi:hypothetical protein
MTEDEIFDFRQWEVEMFDHLNKRVVAQMDPARRAHPSYQPTSDELDEIVEAIDAFPPSRWW